MWKILIVDDNFPNRQLLIEVLSSRARSDAAANGPEAVALYEKAVQDGTPYEAVLLDIAMPQVSGLDVLKKIRESEKKSGRPNVPVIMVTAFKETFVDAFNLGCTDYVVKPIDPATLINLLQRKIPAK